MPDGRNLPVFDALIEMQLGAMPGRHVQVRADGFFREKANLLPFRTKRQFLDAV